MLEIIHVGWLRIRFLGVEMCWLGMGGGGGGGPFTGALPLNLPEDGNVQKQHYS